MMLAPRVESTVEQPADADPIPPVCFSASGGNMCGLTGQYFNGDNFQELKNVRQDAVIDFNWTTPPFPGLAMARFSVRWSGSLHAPFSGVYRIDCLSCGRARLWLGEQLVIDNWSPHDTETDSCTIELAANQTYPLRIEFHAASTPAKIQLLWRLPNQAPNIKPVIE